MKSLEAQYALEEQKALATKCDDTPEGFGYFFRLMHGTPLRPGAMEWVEMAYKAKEEELGFLNEVHREGSKTTIFSKFFLAFRIGHEPEKTNLVIRINGTKADETTSAVATIIRHNPRWGMVFPHVAMDKEKGWGANGYFVKRTDMEYEEWVELRTRVDDYPTFVGYGWDSGSIVGSRVSGICLVDDIVDTQTVKSEKDLASIANLVYEVLTLTIKVGAWEIWNFTPYAFNDIYQELKTTGEYLVNHAPVMYPAKEGDEGAELWPEDERVPLSGKWWRLAWPKQWSFARLTKKYKKIGQIRFARQMLLDLEAMRGSTLKQEWMQPLYPADQIDPSWVSFFGVDYASTRDKLKLKKRDYFTIAWGKVLPGGGLIVTGGFRGHVTKKEGLDLIASYYPIHLPQMIGVEAIGKGEEFYTDLMVLRDMRGNIYPLHEIKSHGRKSKGERIEDWLAPRVQSGRIMFSNAPDSFLTEFENEWLLYPNAQHDDCLDAVYMLAKTAEGHLYDKTRPMTQKRERKDDPLFAMARMNG